MTSSLQRDQAYPDPVVGRIELPPWLVQIQSEPAVRRMFFIRQLGLKAYKDYPGAIHTRYSHALGVMQLAGRVVKALEGRMTTKENIAGSLKDNINTVMAAGFLHDIAHGPFSHAVDYALQSMKGKTHETLVADILKGRISDTLERSSISTQSVIQIINGKHPYPFLHEIVNGPMDADKLDYLLRDAYHIGLRYSFDLDQFISQFRIIGEETDLGGCRLGLADSGAAVVTAELFIMIWKSMYDLVYYVQDSRIAEKMLEKAILSNKDNDEIKKSFDTEGGYLELHDEHLFEVLSRIPSAKDTIDSIRRGEVFKLAHEQVFDVKSFELDPSFIAKFGGKENDRSELSDVLSKKLCEELKVKEYSVIVDLVKSRAPTDIDIDRCDPKSKIYDTLGSRSKIFKDLTAETKLKVYSDPRLTHFPSSDSLSGVLKGIIENTKF
jgi:HD superfamily phosphohydrolase